MRQKRHWKSIKLGKTKWFTCNKLNLKDLPGKELLNEPTYTSIDTPFVKKWTPQLWRHASTCLKRSPSSSTTWKRKLRNYDLKLLFNSLLLQTNPELARAARSDPARFSAMVQQIEQTRRSAEMQKSQLVSQCVTSMNLGTHVVIKRLQ